MKRVKKQTEKISEKLVEFFESTFWKILLEALRLIIILVNLLIILGMEW